MRKFLFVIALILPMIGWAQLTVPVEAEVTWSDGDVTLEDIYIEKETREGDELSYGTMQDEIAYIGDNEMRQYIRPNDVQRIEFEYADSYHVLISTFFNSNYHMMVAETDNKLRVLRYFPTVKGDETFFETDDINIRVLSIEGGNQGNNTKIFRLGFRRSMMDLFQDYPDMQKLIKNRTYTYDNWEEMVEYFNATYGETEM